MESDGLSSSNLRPYCRIDLVVHFELFNSLRNGRHEEAMSSSKTRLNYVIKVRVECNGKTRVSDVGP